jgi:hypothetical protein
LAFQETIAIDMDDEEVCLRFSLNNIDARFISTDNNGKKTYSGQAEIFLFRCDA